MNYKSWKWAAGLAAILAVSVYGGSAIVQAASVNAEEAKAIALRHAGVSASEVNHIRIDEDYEHGTYVYDIKFYTDDMEYDYDIAQDTGEILKYDHEVERRGHRRGPARHVSAPKLSIDEARDLALARVPGADGRDIRIKRDHDHGRATYEGDIYYDGYEYEFEIDADTGEFLEWKKDR